MKAWVKYALVLIVVVAIVVVISVYFAEERSPPPIHGWSEEALDYRDKYLWCVQSKTGMPAAYFPEAVSLMRCSAEKLANRTDGIVDLLDIRACEVTYCVDKGYFPPPYADACVNGLSVWESKCNVPYPIDCSEIVDFIETNHDHIDAAIKECEA